MYWSSDLVSWSGGGTSRHAIPIAPVLVHGQLTSSKPINTILIGITHNALVHAIVLTGKDSP